MRPDGLERARQAALAEWREKPIAARWWRDALVLAAINAAVALACVLALSGGGWIGNRSGAPVLAAVAAPILLVLLLGGVAAVVPERRRTPAALLVLGALAAAAVVVGGSGHGDARGLFAAGMPCLSAEVAMAIVPTAAAVFVLSRFAYSPLRMFVGGLAGGAAGLFALHLHGPIGTAAHLALFHVAPWISAAGLAVLVRSRVRSHSHAP